MNYWGCWQVSHGNGNITVSACPTPYIRNCKLLRIVVSKTICQWMLPGQSREWKHQQIFACPKLYISIYKPLRMLQGSHGNENISRYLPVRNRTSASVNHWGCYRAVMETKTSWILSFRKHASAYYWACGQGIVTRVHHKVAALVIDLHTSQTVSLFV